MAAAGTGRLLTVTTGDNVFTYGYEPNAPELVSEITANNGTTDVVTTTRTYDDLSRLTQVTAAGIVAGTVSSHAYTYDTANQRTKATLADGSYWQYTYDDLGQVIGGVKKLPDGTPIPGMSFGYTFDDIGNRIEAETTCGRLCTGWVLMITSSR